MTSPSAGRPVARCANRDHCGPKTKRSAPLLLLTAVAFVASALIVAGCSSSGSSPQLGSPDPSSSLSTDPSTTPSTSAPQPTPRQQVLAQYRGFWLHLDSASRAPAGGRRAILAPYTADPELSSLLRGIARDRAKGRVFYGTPVIHATVSLAASAPNVAVVRDCQDATKAGDKDKKTGRLLTAGTPHTLVVSTLHRSAGGVWRVAFVTFPKRSC